MEYAEVCRKIAEEIESGAITTREQLDQRKLHFSKVYHLPGLISNPDILSVSSSEKVQALVRRKPTRTLSGVAVVAVMTRPHPCPHGRCIYCPGGKTTPQSYTGREPAAMRAIQYDYDPFLQVASRLSQLQAIGHPTDKCELIVMGGTFPSEEIAYQQYVVKRCFDAFNGKDAKSVEEALVQNEGAAARVIGVTFETRPDWCRREHVERVLAFGGTRVELGVQTLDEDVYQRVGRGHTVEDVISATRWLKDAGLKVGYHMMPGLPGSDPEKDREAFRRLFADADFRPDMLKIYPCQVLEDTELFNLYQRGEYTPYSEEDLVELLVDIKQMLPPYVRVMRIGRDIPSPLIVAGIKQTNIGQIVERKLKEVGGCQCIRCREVGRTVLREKKDVGNVELLREEYEASQGEEVFLTVEDVEANVLIAFLRLRIPHSSWREEIGEEAAIVRELRVYGPLVPLGKKPGKAWQHRGYGEELLREAERISRDRGKERLLVCAGVGVREYYRRLGYTRVGPYMGVELHELG